MLAPSSASGNRLDSKLGNSSLPTNCAMGSYSLSCSKEGRGEGQGAGKRVNAAACRQQPAQGGSGSAPQHHHCVYNLQPASQLRTAAPHLQRDGHLGCHAAVGQVHLRAAAARILQGSEVERWFVASCLKRCCMIYKLACTAARSSSLQRRRGGAAATPAHPGQAAQRQPSILLQELQLAQVEAHETQQQLA